MPLDVHAWQQRLAESLVKYDVPGASVAVLHAGEVSAFAAGVLNQDTRVDVTSDSVFQIGSVTKAYTATLALVLVHEGLLDLDAPVSQYVPELSLADPGVREQLTMRHLLTHTSGLDGDHFLDLGRGEDVLARYVDTCADVSQVMPLGAAWSYCNTGYALAGRVIEAVTGEVFDAALTTRLLDPLTMSRSCLLPEDALRHRVAFGHVPGPEGIMLAPVPVTPRTMAPAGGVMATADDVLKLVRLYLDDGRTAAGRRLLAEDAVASAWTAQVAVPDPSMGTAWGLGWMLTDWDGHRVVGHDGGTIGQGAFVRVLPDQGTAVVLQANGPAAGELLGEIVGGLTEELCDTRPPAPHVPVGSTRDERPAWLGTYARENMRITLGHDDDGLTVEVEIGGLAADSLGASSFGGRVERAADGTYLTDAVGDWMVIVPLTLEDGTECVHFGGRIQRRVSKTD
jgi:CubicO group peptidase (beta-lactamase class C family)